MLEPAIGREPMTAELVFIACPRVEYLRDELAHGRPVVAKKVVHPGENGPRKDDAAREGQRCFILREARAAVGCAGERPKQPRGVSHDRRTQLSRSRNSSDSSPSFVSVDSKRRVDGGRRPV